MIHINIIPMEVNRMWGIFTVVLSSLSILGVLWCFLGWTWITKIHKRYKEQIDKPWKISIEEYKHGEISIEEFNKQHSFFLQISNKSFDEYERISPIYIIKHWNDHYDKQWLEERNYGRVTNEKP